MGGDIDISQAARLGHFFLNVFFCFVYMSSGLTDVQTLILAGIATVIPLLIAVATILGIRFLWRRYRQRKGEGYEGVLQREESSDPLGKIQGHSIPQEVIHTNRTMVVILRLSYQLSLSRSTHKRTSCSG